MSIKIDPALPISFRIDIKLVMFKTFRKNIQYFNSFTIFFGYSRMPWYSAANTEVWRPFFGAHGGSATPSLILL